MFKEENVLLRFAWQQGWKREDGWTYEIFPDKSVASVGEGGREAEDGYFSI